jgi:hypothetical protein
VPGCAFFFPTLSNLLQKTSSTGTNNYDLLSAKPEKNSSSKKQMMVGSGAVAEIGK